MKIVLDTNVLVSGVLSPNGPPAAVLRALLTEHVTLCFDERIVSEYRDVLTQAQAAFDRELVEDLIGFLESAGSPTLAAPRVVDLPEPWDQMFIEVALSSGADFLVTGNIEHFPEEGRAGVRVVSPREFLDVLIGGS